MPFQALQIILEMQRQRNNKKAMEKKSFFELQNVKICFFKIAKHVFFISLHFDPSYFINA